ncbi:MAG: DUF3795 domain-containing protein [Candidatus Bathyarchaeales archaeon]
MLRKNEWNLVAPCGLYCGECTAYLNKKCGGCRSKNGLSKKYQKYCKIYACSNAKKLKTCIECGEFPCKFFQFFKAETLESSSWFLDVWCNMKQIREISLKEFLKRKEKWLRKREKCAERKGIKYCDECKEWPCELLKREVLVPMDLEKFKGFMEKI